MKINKNDLAQTYMRSRFSMALSAWCLFFGLLLSTHIYDDGEVLGNIFAIVISLLLYAGGMKVYDKKISPKLNFSEPTDHFKYFGVVLMIISGLVLLYIALKDVGDLFGSLCISRNAT